MLLLDSKIEVVNTEAFINDEIHIFYSNCLAKFKGKNIKSNHGLTGQVIGEINKNNIVQAIKKQLKKHNNKASIKYLMIDVRDKLTVKYTLEYSQGFYRQGSVDIALLENGVLKEIIKKPKASLWTKARLQNIIDECVMLESRLQDRKDILHKYVW